MQRGSDFWTAFLAAIGGLMVAVLASYFGGFLGIGFAGLIIGFAAVTYDLQKEDVGGGFPSPTLYARQVAARERMSLDERFAHNAGIRALCGRWLSQRQLASRSSPLDSARTSFYSPP